MSLKNIHQRVGVFIDVQNLYYSAQAIYQKKINFKTILETAVAGRQLIRAIAYVVKAEHKDEQTFFDALINLGIEVKMKDLQIFYGGKKKGDWDVGITTDIIKLAPKLDAVVLASGDGDFESLIDYLQINQGCRAEVISFGKSTSAKLIEKADDFVDLDQENEQYLITDHKRVARERATRNRTTR